MREKETIQFEDVNVMPEEMHTEANDDTGNDVRRLEIDKRLEREIKRAEFANILSLSMLFVLSLMVGYGNSHLISRIHLTLREEEMGASVYRGSVEESSSYIPILILLIYAVVMSLGVISRLIYLRSVTPPELIELRCRPYAHFGGYAMLALMAGLIFSLIFFPCL